MSINSSIEWTEATWNPTTGCDKISPGCMNCYAERFAERWRGVPNHPYEQGFDIRVWQNRLRMPLSWKKSRIIFVNSMSDLFHDKISEDFIMDVFSVMREADWHQFQVLTKRPVRMLEISNKLGGFPDNVWAGVSVESQSWVWRVEVLKKVSSKIKFLSCEPLLGSLSLSLEQINWVIVGGESGSGARPIQVDWVRSIREQCQLSGVPFFFKQWGGVQKSKHGRELDGRTWDEFPEVNCTQKLTSC
jgi:protein gp37